MSDPVFGGTSLCKHTHLAAVCSVSGQCRIEQLERELAEARGALAMFQSAVAHVLESPNAQVSSSDGWTMMRSARATDLACAEERSEAARTALREACDEAETIVGRVLGPAESENEWANFVDDCEKIDKALDGWRKAAGLE